MAFSTRACLTIHFRNVMTFYLFCWKTKLYGIASAHQYIAWYIPVQQPPYQFFAMERAQKLLQRSLRIMLFDFSSVTPWDNKVVVYTSFLYYLCNQRADLARSVKTAARGWFLCKFGFPIMHCLSEHSVPLPLLPIVALQSHKYTWDTKSDILCSAWTTYTHVERGLPLEEYAMLNNTAYSQNGCGW